MSTRLLLEGTSLESLLTRVRDEYGADAHIVSAERVRTGGLGGFFTKERYELTVEVGDEIAGARHTTTARHAAPESPAAQVQAARVPPPTQTPTPPTPPPTQTPTPPTPPPLTGEATRPSPASLEDLVAVANTADVVSSFAQVLASARDEPPPLAAQVRRVAADPLPVPQAPPAEENARHPTPPPTVKPIRSGGSSLPYPVARYLPELRASESRETIPPPSLDTPPPASEAVRADQTVLTPPPTPTPARRPVPPPASTPTSTPTPTPAHAKHAGAPTGHRVTDKPTRPAPLAGRLITLGLPEWLATRATTTDMYSAIAGTLSDLPAAPNPPSGRGDVLVVLGDVAGAVAAARAVLATWRLDADVMAVAGPNTVAGAGSCRLTGQADAGRWAARLRMGDTPGIVVVEADLDTRSAGWVRSIVAAVGSTATWAVIDATRKTADCARWLESLGHVDALAVHSTSGTSDPASVLSLGLPVTMIDGQPATPHTWAALLCQRLTESSHAHR